jgi:hypothetical protein
VWSLDWWRMRERVPKHARSLRVESSREPVLDEKWHKGGQLVIGLVSV